LRQAFVFPSHGLFLKTRLRLSLSLAIPYLGIEIGVAKIVARLGADGVLLREHSDFGRRGFSTLCKYPGITSSYTSNVF
jgi:hypothetical protein